MKVALINPPCAPELRAAEKIEPIGIGYIAAYLAEKDIISQLFDFAFSDKSNEELIKNYNLDC